MKKQYNFTRFKIGSGFAYDGLTITNGIMNLSKSFMEKRIKAGEDVIISYDKLNQAILVKPVSSSVDNEAYKISAKGRIRTNVKKVMPDGRYYFIPIVGEFDGYVCELRLTNKEEL